MTTVEWKTLRDELPADVQERLNAKRDARQLGRALADIRKAADVSQHQLATQAGMTQNTVSKIENASDVLLSSLLRYMQAIGGSVEIVLRDAKGGARVIDFGTAAARETA